LKRGQTLLLPKVVGGEAELNKKNVSRGGNDRRWGGGKGFTDGDVGTETGKCTKLPLCYQKVGGIAVGTGSSGDRVIEWNHEPTTRVPRAGRTLVGKSEYL